MGTLDFFILLFGFVWFWFCLLWYMFEICHDKTFLKESIRDAKICIKDVNF